MSKKFSEQLLKTYPLLIYIGKKQAMLFVQVNVAWIMPVLCLHQAKAKECAQLGRFIISLRLCETSSSFNYRNDNTEQGR